MHLCREDGAAAFHRCFRNDKKRKCVVMNIPRSRFLMGEMRTRGSADSAALATELEDRAARRENENMIVSPA